MTVSDEKAEARESASAYMVHLTTCNCERCKSYRAGFLAGLRHARTWRPLTSAPETWPECGERVLFLWRNGAIGIGQRGHATRDMVLWDGYEYPIHPIADALAWLPLPPPEVTP